jgi:hypothetical protein
MPPTFEDAKDLHDFQRMVDYYGMTLGIYPVGIHRLENAEMTKNPVIVSGLAEYKIESEEWATYIVSPLVDAVNPRYIESYEVTLGQNSTVQVGWVHSTQQNLINYLTSEKGRGVGYGTASHSIDCVKSAMVVNGDPFDLARSEISIKEGTIIRSEKKGESWYIDDVLVASASQTGDNVLEISLGTFRGGTFAPCISIKGSCTISAIELEF